MKSKLYQLNTVLAAVVFIAVLACVILRTFMPAVMLPGFDIPNIVLISLLALLIDHYAGGRERCYICIPVFSCVTFGVLPWAAGMLAPIEAVWLGIAGGVIFTFVTWLFSSMQHRLSSGPAAKAAPVICALCLYLAAQGFMGILL